MCCFPPWSSRFPNRLLRVTDVTAKSRTHPGRARPLPPDIKRSCPCTPRTRPCSSPCNSAHTRCISHAQIPLPHSCDDAGVACAGGGLADKGDLARKSPTAPSLLDPGVRRASAPPLYIHLHLWSCSVALRPPPTWPSLMRVRAAVLRRGALLRKNRQPRHPCAPHVCSGRHPGIASKMCV